MEQDGVLVAINDSPGFFRGGSVRRATEGSAVIGAAELTLQPYPRRGNNAAWGNFLGMTRPSLYRPGTILVQTQTLHRNTSISFLDPFWIPDSTGMTERDSIFLRFVSPAKAGTSSRSSKEASWAAPTFPKQRRVWGDEDIPICSWCRGFLDLFLKVRLNLFLLSLCLQHPTLGNLLDPM